MPSFPTSRRQVLRTLSVLVGGTLSLPVQAALRGKRLNSMPMPLAAEQEALVAALADVILPPTDTPGAAAAGVGEFIVRVMANCTSAAEQAAFEEGLRRTDAMSREAFGKPFQGLAPADRIALMQRLATEEKPFFRTLRELTIVGYFTSEIGATQALEYVPVPGRFQGDIPLQPGQRAWAN